MSVAALLALGMLLLGHADLVEPSVSVSRRTIAAGSSVRVTDTVSNRGPAAAGASVTAYYLSRDRIRDSRDRRLGSRPVRALRPGAASRGSRTLPIPRSTPDASYLLLACADDHRRVRESSEANNCRSTGLIVTRPPGDRTPPTFAGLKSAHTCIPGPVDGGRTATYHLVWDAAADDVTGSDQIEYDVYQATAPGREDFSAPTYTTAPGATSFTTPPLPGEGSYYFVVRARDRAGNRDSNKVEHAGENLCL